MANRDYRGRLTGRQIDELPEKIEEKYSKPLGGIPLGDLSEELKRKLNIFDNEQDKLIKASIQLAATYLIPTWQENTSYKAGSIVRISDCIYQSKVDTSSSPFSILISGNKVVSNDWEILVSDLDLDEYLRITEYEVPEESIPEQFEHLRSNLFSWKSDIDVEMTEWINSRDEKNEILLQNKINELEKQYSQELKNLQDAYKEQAKINSQQLDLLEKQQALIEQQAVIIDEVNRTTFLAANYIVKTV